jgi:hypothetical protein
MYTLRLVVDKPKPKKWGEFEVRKTYTVTKDGKSDGVFGYVVQFIKKRTTLTLVRPDNTEATYTESDDISKFTSGQVTHATGSYYEAFPILNGQTTCRTKPGPDRDQCVDDQFQNGAMVRYDLEDGVYYANTTPRTRGTITMTGVNVFIPTTKAKAEELFRTIQAGTGGTWTAGGDEWSLDSTTPANGLPYRPDFKMPAGPRVVHTVRVEWDVTGKTTVTSETPPQGGRRTTRGRAASRSDRRRRTGRARRPSSRRA